MSYGPPTDPEVRARLQAQLDEANVAIDAAIAACSNCKISRTLTRRAVEKKVANKTISQEAADRRVERAGCDRHRNARHLAYVTSPLSETYWCS